MYMMRYHNLVILFGFLIGIGLTSHFFAKPSSISKHDELTTWLLTFADKDKATLASEKLQAAISDSSGDIDAALEAASKVIAENPDLFNLPKNEDESSDKDVLKVLLYQWKSSHDYSGMAKAVQPERNRSGTAPADFQQTHQGNNLSDLISLGTSYLFSMIPGADDIVNFLIHPLVNGISINAP